MREICACRGVPADIETSESKRIYGRAWYDFLGRCRATLGTESGSNVLDADGNLRRRIDAALAAQPDMSYEDIHARFIGNRDGAIQMNQISPRVFEAAAMRTGLVLFEGDYSGVLVPDQHYLSLRKDFSNADEVLERLEDTAALGAMIDRAYDHLIASGRFSYQSFVKALDDHISATDPRSRSAVIPIQRIAPPIVSDGRGFMAAVPHAPTDIPFQIEWLVPEARKERGLKSGIRRLYRAARGRFT